MSPFSIEGQPVLTNETLLFTSSYTFQIHTLISEVAERLQLSTLRPRNKPQTPESDRQRPKPLCYPATLSGNLKFSFKPHLNKNSNSAIHVMFQY